MLVIICGLNYFSGIFVLPNEHKDEFDEVTANLSSTCFTIFYLGIKSRIPTNENTVSRQAIDSSSEIYSLFSYSNGISD